MSAEEPRRPEPEGLKPRELRLELPCSHDTVRVARSMVRHFSRLQGMPDQEVDLLMLVASELLDNAVDHGGGGAAMSESEALEGTHMTLRLALAGRGWTIEVADQGGGDPAEMRKRLSAAQLPGLEQERGRGMYLVENLVDRVDVRKSEDCRGLLISATRFDANR